ncbi:MAG: magnesium transporter [Clostridiales bacterium]|nr:magnesium transporter [Clostridiales bacterium]
MDEMLNDELLKYFAEKNYEEAAEAVKKLSPEELAQILCNVPDDDLLPFCHEIDSSLMADVLVLLDTPLQKKIVEGLRDAELEDVMEDVSVEDTVDIIEELPEEVARRIAEEEEILELLKERKFSVLKPLLASMNEIDLADVFESANEEDLPVLFRILPKDAAAETFVEIDRDTQEALLKKLTDHEIKDVMEELFLDDTVDLVEEMPANVVKRLLAQSDGETRGYINELLKYPKDSAGSLMTIEFVSFTPNMTVAEAFDRIRETAIDKETIYTCYVTDSEKKLIGLVTAKDLLLADKSALISEIMEDNVIYANTLDDREEVSRKITDYGFIALPVTDNERRLVGIITVDDAIDVLQEENTEDFERMAKIVPANKPYLKTSVFSLWKSRAPWLLILLISATFTGLIINSFEGNLNAISPVLFACVPMLMDTGGNSGSQVSVTVIRALALGELTIKDSGRVVWKEIRVSLLLAATLAVACFAKLMLIDNLLFGYADYDVILCAIVSLALFCTVVIAKLVGCLLPLLVKACKLDPAAVASPFITTIVDAISLMIFCGLSIAILG